MGTVEDWAAARAALRAGRWDEAAASFAALADEGGDPRAQEGLAQVGWWRDDAALALGAREAAYRSFRTQGDDRGAARAAAALGYDSILFGKGVAVGRGGSPAPRSCWRPTGMRPRSAGWPCGRPRWPSASTTTPLRRWWQPTGPHGSGCAWATAH